MRNGSEREEQTVIIGAGPAGLTAAYELTKLGQRPVVLEKYDKVGGLSRTEDYKGFYFDMGGHRFFTKSKDVNRLWAEVLGNEFLHRPRSSRIYYNNKFFDYPLKPLNALRGLGFWQSVLIILSYIRWQLFPNRREETYEQWVTNRFGQRLFLTFFKAYTEKVWGIPCSELKAEWAAQRIKDLSLKSALLSMFFKPKRTITTLIDQFYYPRLGPGMMWNAFRRQVEERGGTVRTNSDVVEIRRTGNRIDSVVVCSGHSRCNGHEQRDGCHDVIEGSDFISSMPVTEFVQKLEPLPPPHVLEAAASLKYRDFLTVCLILNKPDLFPDNWIYIHDPRVHVGRIQNFKNWSPEMVPDSSKTSLGLEYFCTEGDEVWNTPDHELVELAKRELEQIGLARYDDVADGCVFRVAKSYPVYDSDYRDHLTTLKEYVGGLENFQTVGRNGLHRYNNQDHAMLTGMLAVRNMVLGESNDLWSVNSDQEYHEEIQSLQGAFRRAFTKMDRVAFGVSVGASTAMLLFLSTLFLVIKGGPVVGPNLRLLDQYLPGYAVTLEGSLVGLAYGFIIGFSVGWLFAFLRNAAMFLTAAYMRRGAELQALRRVLEYI
jgi:protoporphyrinogen oxidase